MACQTADVVVHDDPGRAGLGRLDVDALQLADRTGDAICILDAAGCVTHVNANLEALVGYRSADIVGRNFNDFFPADISEQWDEFTLRPTHLPEVAEFELMRADGSLVSVLLTVVALGDEHFEGAVAVLRDISERIAAARQLADRERSLAALVANVTGMVYRSGVEAEGDLSFASDGSSDLTGWTPAELVGEQASVRYRDLIVPADWSRVEKAMAGAREDDQAIAVQYRIVHRDGSVRSVWDRARLVDPHDGGPAHFEGLAMDITPFIDSRHAAQASEARFRKLVDGFPAGIVVSQRGRIVLANRSAASIFKTTTDALIGYDVMKLLAPEDLERATAAARAVADEGSPVTLMRYGIFDLEGQRREIDALHFTTSFDEEPAQQAVFWDVTRARRTNRLRQAHELVVAGMTNGDPVEANLRHVTDAVAGLLPGRHANIRRYHAPRPTADVDAGTPKRVGPDTRLWSTPIVDGAGRALGTFELFSDSDADPTSEERVLIQQLNHLATIVIEQDDMRHGSSPAQLDPLTGLANRALALETLERDLVEVAAGGRDGVAVLLLDIDDFSVLNQTLGQDVGDEVLRSVADLLAALVDRDAVARFGSDAFLIRVRGRSSEAELDVLARRLQARISAPFQAGGREVYVSASIGLAVSDREGGSAHSLVAGAEAALFHAKSAGPGGQRHFDDRIRSQARRRVELLPALRRAIEEGELRLHYQPQVELTTGVVVGVEALVRWMHPEEGLLGADEFIPAAEGSGLILPLGGWVLEEASRQAARWRDLRPERELSVSINVSARQLADPLLIERVENALSASSLDPGRLRLELTETAVMADAASAEMLLRRLRAVGVRLSIDDFGTGYSSLAYLKRFPVDELKIDGSFVAGLGRRADDSAIVAATIRLAESLGITTVAEGVERPEQAAELVRLGCEVGQGYLWMRPSPPEDVDAIVNEGSQAAAIRETAIKAIRRTTVVLDADEALRIAVHELRSPLTVISGYAELLDDPALLETARPAISRASRRMEGILQSLADVHAIDRGSLTLDLATHDVADVVNEIVDDIVSTGIPSVVEVEVDLEDASGRSAIFDRPRIEQVITNLVTNAVRYGPTGGRIRVVVAGDPSEWSCAVVDEGEGVLLEQATAIFRKYARGTRKAGGTGIGLYLARGVARAHGGELIYRRADGGGAEFRMTLPRSTE